MDEIILSEEQLRLTRHMIGFNKDKKNKLPYRNYFFSYTPVEELEDLVNKELATKNRSSFCEGIYYYLNKNVIEFLIGRKISDEDYKNI